MSRASARLAQTAPGFELAPRTARMLRTIEQLWSPATEFGFTEDRMHRFLNRYSAGESPEPYLPGLVIDTAKLAARCYAGPPGPTQRRRELLENYRFSPDRLFPGGIRVSNRPPGFAEWSEDYARLADVELSTRQHREPSPLSDIRQSLLEVVNYMQQAADYWHVRDEDGFVSRPILERSGIVNRPASRSELVQGWHPGYGDNAHQIVYLNPGQWMNTVRIEVEGRQAYEDRLDARRVQMQIEYESRWWNTPAPLDEELHEALPQGYELSLDPTPAGKGDPLAGVLGGMDRLLSRIDELVD